VCHPGYLSSYGSEYGYICGYEKERLLCFIPFTVKHKLIFHYIEFKCQTVILDDKVDEKIFLNNMIDFLKSQKAYDFISQPPTNTLFRYFPDGSCYSEFGSYRIDLSVDEDSLWKQIHAKHKNVIRRAKKEGVLVKIGDHYFDQAYEIIDSTLRRNHMRMLPKEQLLRMRINMRNSFLVACSFKDEILQSSAIILYSKYGGYYFWGGTSENIVLGANNLLHWEIIKVLKSKKVYQYDFVGARIRPEKSSRLEGIQRFKKRFGASMHRGYLWKYPLKPWKFKLFYLMLKLKQKKGDIIDQEKDSSYL